METKYPSVTKEIKTYGVTFMVQVWIEAENVEDAALKAYNSAIILEHSSSKLKVLNVVSVEVTPPLEVSDRDLTY